MIAGYEHAVQISVLFKAVGMGYLIGLLYCFFSFLNSINKNNIAVFIRDILFFVLNAVISFLFLLRYNSGVIRFYILAGEGIGFLLFYLFPGMMAEAFIRRIFGRLTMKISGATSEIKKKVLCYAKRCFLKLKNRINNSKAAQKKSSITDNSADSTKKTKRMKILRKKGKKNYKNT